MNSRNSPFPDRSPHVVPLRRSRAGARRADLRAALQHLVASAEPAVVFSSLAGLCAPGFSDECRVVILEDNEISYRIQRPWSKNRADLRTAETDVASWGGQAQRIGARTIGTAITAMPGQPSYRGVVLHEWKTGYRPTELDATLARLAVAHAVAAVHRERLEDLARHPNRELSEAAKVVRTEAMPAPPPPVA